MYDSAKYLIHADVEASGVVERSDVVGAVFGQTEGLLGDELDLRDLQESQKLGRIDVEIRSEGGRSYGEITIASGLDRVETAILAAALESIERVGPCRADVEITDLEDVRTAKRREIVDRATELLAEFDETAVTSEDIVEEVREAVRVADVTDYHGFPAGPRVADSDAIIVVEGRSDVLTLLRYGVKNAIAVEGTDVPDAVSELTSDRTVTAFLDGDRGGDLILKELAQVGEIDYVALAPPDRSVEDLSRGEVMTALREKVPFEAVDDDPGPDALAATDGSARPAPTDGNGTRSPDGNGTRSPDATPESAESPRPSPGSTQSDAATGSTESPRESPPVDADEWESGSADDATAGTAADDADAAESETDESAAQPTTLRGHVDAVVGAGSGLVRVLDPGFEVVAEDPVEEAFELLDGLDSADEAAAVVIDGDLSQRLLDVAAQRGVDQVVCAEEGEFVKQPADVAVRTAADLEVPDQ